MLPESFKEYKTNQMSQVTGRQMSHVVLCSYQSITYFKHKVLEMKNYICKEKTPCADFKTHI